LDSRIAEVLDQYSPILEGVEAKEFKEQVKNATPTTERRLPKLVNIVSEDTSSTN
jgi:hypothetical protein